MLRHCTRHFSVARPALANYGFIGLGQMGQHMARHIYNKLDPHDKLYVYDTLPQHTQTFVETVRQTTPENGAQLQSLDSIASFVHDVDAQLDYVITMVPEGKHVKAVVQELVENYKKTDISGSHTTFLDSSTIDIPTSIDIHNYVKQEIPAFDFIDTPVSGGVAGARKGTLSFMLSRESHDAISPSLLQLLTKMGTNIFPCGGNHGTGLAAKLSNNYLLAVTNLAVADSFQLAKSFGLDLKKYALLVAVSTGKSWASVDNCPIKGAYPSENNLPAEVDFAGGFITKLTRKDLVLATQSAAVNNRFLFLGEAGKHWYDKACEREDIANRDLGVLYEWLGELEQNENGQLVEVKGKQ
ncbi:putative 3-hydroxyisobutyrate dehydrogenase mitochondrial precursor [Suhomyces tanzawaensis NRRL Y-17324]|uniref:3-hydroxyisobutyrate dehydrogenase n=1 Tax=Suhomyces tanzawaensis NRRL Y-17324 TaxID=984487 RepID=A0A1E4SR33_9ASCO|nr:putative 3-hydroxyisobutyrate dehydrogenase mitochondrial precursor [Suhomyces tanzawaensis NRRL Y-17324]ODV81964.1 putative 3-hydroxyisobutyrate dehydrogenase mitochondrial precursor [Suhomyces tanzawaensis NRRL Y-17324]